MSMIAHYPLNGDLKDYSGNGHDLINSGAIVNNEGKIGKCYEFDGSSYMYNESIDLERVFSNGNFTISFWANPTKDDTISHRSVLVWSDDWKESGTIYFRNSNTNIGLQYTNKDGRMAKLGSHGGINYSKWDNYTWQVINNGVDYIMKLYINGVYIMGGVDTSLDANIQKYSKFYIGRGISGYIGKLNDVRIYDHVLSDKEIYEISKAKVLHYDFNVMKEPTENHFNIYLKNTLRQHSASDNYAHEYSKDGIYHTHNNLKLDIYKCRGKLRFGNISGADIGTLYRDIYYTFSVYIKKSDNFNGPTFELDISDTYNEFCEIDDYGNIITNYGSHGGAITNMITTEWKRYKITSKHTSSIHQFLDIGSYSDHSGYFYIAGIQLEEKTYATEYVYESREGIVRDVSGFGNDAVLDEHSPQWVDDSDIGSGAYRFNGNIIRCKDFIMPADSFTISLKIREDITNKGNFDRAYIGQTLSSNYSVGWRIVAGYNVDRSYIRCIDKDSVNKVSIRIGNTYVKDKQWENLTYVYNKTDNIIKVYYNGIVQSKYADNVEDIINCLNLYDLCIGNLGAMGNKFLGDMADVRIYATSLSPEDIKDLYDECMTQDNKGNLVVNELVEYENTFSNQNNAIKDKQFKNGLDIYVQSHCKVTLNDEGVNIFRTPNLIHGSDGNVMWGGVQCSDMYNFRPNRKYKLLYKLKGKSSICMETPYFAYDIGWSNGGGIGAIYASEYSNLPKTYSFDTDWVQCYAIFNTPSDVYKVATRTEGEYITGNTYYIMRELKLGFGYGDTGPMGSDVTIKDINIIDITDENEELLEVTAKKQLKCVEISEVGITDGLIGFWKFNGNVKDYSGNKYHGELLKRGTGELPEVSGDHVKFNGIDISNGGYVNTPLKKLNKEMTISIKGRSLSDTYQNALMSIGDNNLILYIKNDNRVGVYINGSTSYAGTNTTELHHFVIKLSSNTSSDETDIEVYSDGNKIKSSTIAKAYIYDTILSNGLSFGQDWDGGTPTDFWNGELHEFKMFNRLLSDKEIEIEYTRLMKPNEVQNIQESGTVYCNSISEGL